MLADPEIETTGDNVSFVYRFPLGRD